MSERWLTVAQFSRTYQIDRTKIYKLIADGELVAQKIGKRGHRILDPGKRPETGPPKPAAETIDAAYMIRTAEAALILGVTRDRIKQLVKDKKLDYRMSGNQRMFNVDTLFDRYEVVTRGLTKKKKPPQAVRNGIVLWVAARIAEKLKDRIEGVQTLKLDMTPTFVDLMEVMKAIETLPADQREDEFATFFKKMMNELKVKSGT